MFEIEHSLNGKVVLGSFHPTTGNGSPKQIQLTHSVILMCVLACSRRREAEKDGRMKGIALQAKHNESSQKSNVFGSPSIIIDDIVYNLPVCSMGAE